MEFKKEELKVNEKLLNKIRMLCKFNNSKLEFKNGYVFKIKGTNINILEPHRFIISVKDIKLVVLSYDNLNICVYSKNNMMSIAKLRKIIVNINGECDE